LADYRPQRTSELEGMVEKMKLRSRALKNLPIVMLMTKEGPELGSSSKAGFHAATSASAHDAPTAVYQWRSFATAEFFWVTLA